jgi:hypothetical protein
LRAGAKVRLPLSEESLSTLASNKYKLCGKQIGADFIPRMVTRKFEV